MTSSLAWLDHDASARERTKRILALFQESGTQDQLGLGGIRDSFADLLFPGTSTIQTRLRYFLFIPWIYTRLEQDEVPARRFGAVARERELSLVEPLLSKREDGVFGRTAGKDLKRLPSEVYWGGLGSWGIRRFAASRDQYHRAVDDIYRRRKASRGSARERVDEDDGVITWHRELPAPPESFPEDATLQVTFPEAEFLRDRIVAEHPASLLAWLALRDGSTAVPYVWEHPLEDEMLPQHRRILRHGRLFSEAMHGAPLLYNLMLSELAANEEMADENRSLYAEWTESLNVPDLMGWNLDELFAIARGQGGHTITVPTEDFVRRWVALVREGPERIPDSRDARELIRRREMLLKGARSLFRNRRALEERYNGGLGLGRHNFRWPDVQVLLNDLHAGLSGV